MKVADVMSSPLISVGEGATFKEVVDVLIEHDVSAVPVLDEEHRPVGVIAEADLLSRAAFGPERRGALQLVAGYFRGEDPQWLRKSSGMTARELMSGPVRTASPGWTVAQAARAILDAGVRRLIVVDPEGRGLGVVSRQDLLRQFAGSDAEITTGVSTRLADIRYVPEDAHVTFTVSDGVVDLTGDVLHPSDCQVVSHAVASVPGVVSVACHLAAREPEPSSR